jgi:hypothetical protein
MFLLSFYRDELSSDFKSIRFVVTISNPLSRFILKNVDLPAIGTDA